MAIRDLTDARPHMRKNVKYSIGELRAYQEGYYTGLIMALRVADLAVENYKRVTALLRAATRKGQAG